MLPETSIVRKQKGVYYLKNSTLLVNREEADSIASSIRGAYRDPTIKVLIIDNSEAIGVWKPEAQEEAWAVVGDVMTQSSKKSVTLTKNIIATAQINRLAQKHGLSDRIKAFENGLTNEVWQFLEHQPEEF